MNSSRILLFHGGTRPFEDSAIDPAFPWRRPMDDPMKITDTVDQVLKNKCSIKSCPFPPSRQSIRHWR